MDDLRKNPELVIRRGCGTDGLPVDETYLGVLTTKAMYEPQYRTVALADLFLDMVIEGYLLPEISDLPDDDDECERPRNCPWHSPLFGLFSALHSITEGVWIPGRRKPRRQDYNASFTKLRSGVLCIIMQSHHTSYTAARRTILTCMQ